MTFNADHGPLPFVLCADDYGIAPGVSRGIRELIDGGVLTATGCMTAGPFWPAEAPPLLALQDKADIGLHFVLTDHRPAGAMPKLAPHGRLPSLPALLKRALLRQLDKTEIKRELSAQLDLFVRHFGRLPDFIDGHHHVHQLPIVRHAVIEAIQDGFGDRPVWLRSCWERPEKTMRRGVATKRALVITQLGRPLDRLARKLGIRTNRGFRGVYDFTGDYAARFDKFLAEPERTMLVMCHPGYADPELAALDPVTDSREAELAYFLSPRFRHALERSGVAPVRLSRS